ncbi:MAG: Fe-S cluster assembly protein SufD [Bacteroidales bacterium]|jgi:Fe-S cluster assembly protein SufD
MNSINQTLISFAKSLILEESSGFFKAKRQEALEVFEKKGLPKNNNKEKEEWRDLRVDSFLNNQYVLETNNLGEQDYDFECEVDNMNANAYVLLNGSKITHQSNNLSNNKIVVTDIKNLPKDKQNLFGSLCDIDDNGYYAINTAAFSGGFYMEVPENTTLEVPIQLISILSSKKPLFTNSRNFIFLGKNSHLKLIQCDDDISNFSTFNNNVTEIFVDENSTLDIYKMHNLSNDSVIINSILINQKHSSKVNSFTFEFNAGLLRSNLISKLIEKEASFNAYGIYLQDKEQVMDNYVKVEHIAPECTSEQIYKGILDDMSSSIFTGNVVVNKNAQQTFSSQINRNILLTDKAKAKTKPFLQIYADDVKCSHGATTGLLDEEALFYLQQRGISLENSKKLLMNAFLGEVIEKLDIDELKIRVNDIVRRRLNGELSRCNTCLLPCSDSKRTVQGIL